MKIKMLLVLLLLIGIGGVVLDRISPQSQSAQNLDEKPTVIERGKRSQKERAYDRYYKKNGTFARKLTDSPTQLKEDGSKEEIVRFLAEPMIIDLGQSPEVTGSEFIRNLACKSDAIVVGSSKSKTAHLTEDETWIYTEYEFQVHDVLKNNSASPIITSNTIKLTRPGGSVVLDNQVIRVVDSVYEQLKKNKRYILFLHYIPDANGYVVADHKADYELNGNEFRKISKTGLPKNLVADDGQSLMKLIRDESLVGCSGNSKGGN